MICRFCSQWNPDGEPRCCFCNNPLAASEDATLSGLPLYTRQVPLVLPGPTAAKPSFSSVGKALVDQVRDAGGLGSWLRGLDRDQRMCLAAGLVMVLAFGVLLLCC